MKLNQVRLDGEPHKPSGFLFAAEIVSVGDKLTKPQDFLAAIFLHHVECKPEHRAIAIGDSPDVRFRGFNPGTNAGAGGASTGFGP